MPWYEKVYFKSIQIISEVRKYFFSYTENRRGFLEKNRASCFIKRAI
jgi:hypothetical protein